jgi:hypothetical protein
MLAEVKLAEIERVERLLGQMRSALQSVRSCRCVDLDTCGALAVQLLASPPEPPSPSGAISPRAGPRRARRGHAGAVTAPSSRP